MSFCSQTSQFSTPFRADILFSKILNETSKFYVLANLMEDFTNLNKLVENPCQLALKHFLKEKAAACAIMLENDPN